MAAVSFSSSSAVLGVPAVSNATNGVSPTEVIEIYQLATALEEVSPDAFICIDIDDTLIDFRTHLGSKPWRNAIKKSALGPYHDLLTLYVAKQMKIEAVEETTPRLIAAYQSQGYCLVPLTARERDCWYDLQNVPDNDAFTYQQLQAAGMDFTQTTHPAYVAKMDQTNFYQGIYFSRHPIGGEKTKGETLKELLEPLLSLPSVQELEVVIIDDKKEQCESVLQRLAELGIKGRGYWYRACETRHADFNFAVSLIQLEELLFNKITLSNRFAADSFSLKGCPGEDALISGILAKLQVSEDKELIELTRCSTLQS